MKGDFTRFTFRPQKHYAGVRRQQGRVDVDADWNEQVDITLHRMHTETKDVIGAHGGPQGAAGFAISPASPLDFSISRGRYYVDGILCENEHDVRYSAQPDLIPDPMKQADASYIVYLDVWQRHITAVDDPEIREVALRGPDTATRMKTVWQVRMLDVGAGVDCSIVPPGWTALIASSTIKLAARTAPEGVSDEPCVLAPGAGYRRLENQLYRVEIHRPAVGGLPPTFKWSRDNGAVVSAIKDIQSNTITLESAKQDSAVGFAPGQWIEVLNDSHELNRAPGVLAMIKAVDGPTLTVEVAQNETLPASVDPKSHPKIRRWDSAGAIDVAVPSGNDGFFSLEDGVEIKFDLTGASCRTGDYWVITARTNGGGVIWPSGTSGPDFQKPHGIDHRYCRLAVIDVDGSSGNVSLVDDCRRVFPPLTEIEDCCGCCTVTVGPTGSADCRTIQEGIEALPPSGGRVCVLPGIYRDPVVVEGKAHVVITGCDDRSIIAWGERPVPLLQVVNSHNIRIESLVFAANAHCAIQVEDSIGVTIRDCEIVMTNRGAPEPAIYFHGQEGLIERNVIRGGDLKRKPYTDRDRYTPKAITMSAIDDFPSDLAGSYGVSGIQLAGGAADVRVLDNLIAGIGRQGIVLGGLEEPSEVSGTGRRHVGLPKDPTDDCDECKPVSGIRIISISRRAGDRQKRDPVVSRPLSEILIARNRIRGTGLDGIGVISFFDPGDVQFVTVRGLRILDNEITGCLRRTVTDPLKQVAEAVGYGGISLADVERLVIQGNTITDNGTAQIVPTCGIFVLHGEGIDISNNLILNNGQAVPKEIPAIFRRSGLADGLCGGIRIVYAVAPIVTTVPNIGKLGNFHHAMRTAEGTFADTGEPTGFPALKVHDNIVSAPRGPALWAGALGPVSVVGNQLTSGSLAASTTVYGKSTAALNLATVFILNLGRSNENYVPLAFFTLLLQNKLEPKIGGVAPRPRLANGNILFSDNQCSLDLLEPGKGFAGASIALLSLDDVAFQNNQSDCNLWQKADFLIADTMVMASSVRVTGNRFKEGLWHAAYSAMTFGILNNTTNNQATHCLFKDGFFLVDEPNTVLASTIFSKEKDYCSAGLSGIIGLIIQQKG